MSDWTITLEKARSMHACVRGYNMVVSSLLGIEFDPYEEQYLDCDFDGQISILSILETNGFEDARWATRCLVGKERDLRLFVVWCARQTQSSASDKPSISAIDVAERYANGKATDSELVDARIRIRRLGRTSVRMPAWVTTLENAWNAAMHIGDIPGLDIDMKAQREMFVRMLNNTAPWQT